MSRNAQHCSAWALAAALAIGLSAAPVMANIVGTTFGELSLMVPDPDNPGKCKEVIFGQFAARLGTDPLQQFMVAGFRKTYTGPTCCDSFHFLNIVVADPNPPSWKGPDGKIHPIKPSEVYIDPLSGGNVPPGKDEANPPANRLPWYDGETTNRLASQVGDFTTGEKKEYDLNDIKDDDGSIFDWTKDPKLDLVFGDAPTLTNGLKFVTLLVCVDDHHICPVGGVAWGRDGEGVNYIGTMFNGNAYSDGLTRQKIQDALARSGFGDYTMRDACCPCIPAPESALLAMLGLTVVLGLRHRLAVIP